MFYGLDPANPCPKEQKTSIAEGVAKTRLITVNSNLLFFLLYYIYIYS